ncbi:signal peptidase I [Enterococcus plantarum]|uniref:signal peptidase I n=1 Tax=Enterococcus plantarum TaxID=1077675 RepID=UPI001A90A8C6|nr:signal peptidase I [Enterococcus plantarum]MBO0421306.1 signal peptidase I [Enterococcus plantarum]
MTKDKRHTQFSINKKDKAERNRTRQKPKRIATTKKKKLNKQTKVKVGEKKSQRVVRRKKKVLKKKHQRNHFSALSFYWKELIITAFIVSGLFLLGSQIFFALPLFEGYGMTPTVSDGDRIYVNRLKKVKRFKLIYFKVPNSKERSIRRVIGLPGEELSFKNDQLLINQQPIVERFLAMPLYRAKQEEQLLTEDFSVNQLSNGQQQHIPKGKYLVLGDNRQYSTDSRYYGMIDEKDIIGVVEARVFPIYKWRSY